jgi:hypothetical protein
LSHTVKQLGRGIIFIGTVEPPKSNKQEKYAGSTIYDDEFPTENKDMMENSLYTAFSGFSKFFLNI